MSIKRKLFVFGVGPSADVAAELFQASKMYEVLGFILDRDYVKAEHHLGLPVVAYEDFRCAFTPSQCDVFVAVGYRKLNRLRSDVFRRVRADGYHLPSLIEERHAIPQTVKFGSNCLVMRGATIHPSVIVGDDVFIWGGATVCHHSRIGSHGWITAGAVIAGNCTVGDFYFVGANATLVNDLKIGNGCFIGAGALVSSDLADKSVVVRPGDGSHRLTSDAFLDLIASKGF